MSLSEELLTLFGKNVSHDAEGINARMHVFGSVPANENPIPNRLIQQRCAPKWWRWCRSMVVSAAALWRQR